MNQPAEFDNPITEANVMTWLTLSQAQEIAAKVIGEFDAAIDAALARSSTQPQMSDSDLTEGGAR